MKCPYCGRMTVPTMAVGPDYDKQPDGYRCDSCHKGADESAAVQRQMVSDLRDPRAGGLGWDAVTNVWCQHRKRHLTMGEVFDTHCTMLLVLNELENR